MDCLWFLPILLFLWRDHFLGYACVPKSLIMHARCIGGRRYRWRPRWMRHLDTFHYVPSTRPRQRVLEGSPVPSHLGAGMLADASPVPSHVGAGMVADASPVPSHVGARMLADASPVPSRVGAEMLADEPEPTVDRKSVV